MIGRRRRRRRQQIHHWDLDRLTIWTSQQTEDHCIDRRMDHHHLHKVGKGRILSPEERHGGELALINELYNALTHNEL